MVIIRSPNRLISEFNDYFLKVLTNNHASFTLLTSYIEQIFNCTVSLTSNENNLRLCSKIFANNGAELKKKYSQSSNIESLINLIYTFALITDKIETTPQLKSLWYVIL